MSQPFDSFNNNNQNASDSDIQNVNNYDEELQQAQPDGGAESVYVYKQNNSEAKINETETLLKDYEPHCPNINIDMPEQDLLPVPSETHSTNVNASENGTEVSQPDNELQSFINSDQTWEIINSKIAALKDFSFSQIGKKKVPVYPYVVALTGHRDAITEPVKEIAKNQLRSLAKAWDKACNAKKWKKKYANKNCNCNCTEQLCEKAQKSAPLIALVGLDDGESGKLWTKIASELRDEEKFNIKVVAVASIPFAFMLELKKKRYELTGNLSDNPSLSPNFIDDIKEIINQIDGLIELPPDNEVRYLLQCLETLGSFCTEDQPHTYDLINMLISNEHSLELQFDEYRKFMCVHSHTLIVLKNNIKLWQNDIEERNKALDHFTSNLPCDKTESADEKTVSAEKLNKYSQDYQKFKKSVRFALKLTELVNDVRAWQLNQKDAPKKTFDELKNAFEELAKQLPEFGEKESRTDQLISYKLFGNIKNRLNPYGDEKIHGITFTSIGPVVCINTDRKSLLDSEGSDTQSNQSKPGDIDILVKDQPNDFDYGLTKLISWKSLIRKFKGIAKFPAISKTIKNLGMINNCCIDKVKYCPEKKDDFLSKHYHYAHELASQYYTLMKKATRFSALMAILFLMSSYTAHIASYVPHNSTIFFATTVLKVSVAFFLISLFISWWNSFSKKHHYFRALADALRIQDCWKLASIESEVAGQYDLHQISSIAWLRAALNGLTISYPADLQQPVKQNGNNETNQTLSLQDNSETNQMVPLQDNNETNQMVPLQDNSENNQNNSLENDLQIINKDLYRYQQIKKYWIDQNLEKLTGVKEMPLERVKNILERYLNNVSFLRGKGAFVIYIMLLVLPSFNNIVHKWLSSNGIGQKLTASATESFFHTNLDCALSSFNYWIIKFINYPYYAIMIVLMVVITVVIEVYNIYRYHSLKNLDIKKRCQLLYPFRRADLLLKLKLLNCFDSIQELKDDNSANQTTSDNNSNNVEIIKHFYKEIQKIIEDLGKIELAISAEWLLASDKRIFKFRKPQYEPLVNKNKNEQG